MDYILIFCIVFLFAFLSRRLGGWEKKTNKYTTVDFMYRKKTFLMIGEENNYRYIKQIADKYNLTILVKTRIIDIVSPYPNNNYIALKKIKDELVDFAICDEEMNILVCLELKSDTRLSKAKKARDIFLKELFQKQDIIFIQANDFRKVNIEQTLEHLV